ncbi:MAG: succinate dehydrogenase cytochrome b subunit [Bryobacteraceae bacterium]
MSAIATAGPLHRVIRFYEATNGKKAVMAVTGVLLFGYVVGHMLGNLQIFLGPRQINRYAEFLHSYETMLWFVRAILLAAVGLHVTAALQLWALNRSARPIGYYRKNDVPSAYAARTMRWGGLIIAAFVIFHVLHLTTGDVLALKHVGDTPFYNVYENVIDGFRHPAVSIAYIVAVLMLCLHLYHGVWSMFQTVGISHPRYTPVLKRLSAAAAIVVAAGFVSIPVAVLTGVLTY